MTSINYQQILGVSKNYMNDEDYIESDFYLNLFFNANCTDL